MTERSIFDLDVIRKEFVMQRQQEGSIAITATIVTGIIATIGCYIIATCLAKCDQ